MGKCWKCYGTLIWDRSCDAEEIFFDCEANGACEVLHCSDCGSVVIYAPPDVE